MQRRDFLKQSTFALSFSVAGTTLLLSPREARAKQVPYKVLTQQEVTLLDAIGDVLVPGASEAGISHFLDQQFSIPADDCLLMARYFNVEPPYLNFYRAAIMEINRQCNRRFKDDFAKLNETQAVEFVSDLRDNKIEQWQGPPATLVYIVLRGDASDVVYGTPEGFEELGVPYMAHIMPPSKW
jgi:Gluconate 2-dehydrogenase subunit 3